MDPATLDTLDAVTVELDFPLVDWPKVALDPERCAARIAAILRLGAPYVSEVRASTTRLVVLARLPVTYAPTTEYLKLFREKIGQGLRVHWGLAVCESQNPDGFHCALTAGHGGDHYSFGAHVRTW